MFNIRTENSMTVHDFFEVRHFNTANGSFIALFTALRDRLYYLLLYAPRSSALFFKASMCWMSFNLRLHPPSNRASSFVTMNRP